MAATTPSTPSPRSRFTRERRGGFVLTERDRQLLADLFLHRAMSRGQLEARHFHSLKRANARLRQLFDHAYVLRSYPEEAPFGAQAVYAIAARAVPVVAEELGFPEHQVRQLTRQSPTPRFRTHTLAVVDFAVRLEAAATGAGIDLVRWVPEILCRQEYEVRARGGGAWQRQVFRPDGAFRLRGARGEADFFLELDLGHTSARQFRDKLAGFATFVEAGVYASTYYGERPTLLVQTTGPRRLQHLAELAGRFPEERILLATSAEVAGEGPLAAVWRTPGGERVALRLPPSRGPPGARREVRATRVPPDPGVPSREEGSKRWSTKEAVLASRTR